MLAYELYNMQFRYDSATRPVLTIPALDIPAGTITAVIGPNGAGKSTLLNLLAFLQVPTDGDMYFQGERVTAQMLHGLRRRVGLVPQNPYLLHASVAANIELGMKLRGVKADTRRVLALTVMEQLQLDALAARPARELSGGEAQKVAIARALVLEPEVLVFDEPFTYLDKKITTEFEQLIMTIREHRAQTIVFSSHDHLRAHALADQVVTLFDGHTMPASLLNHFQGRLDPDRKLFDTGKTVIHVPDGTEPGLHLVVEASQIVISREQLHSSMRNVFRGRVTGLQEVQGQVRVTIQAGETFLAVITRDAMRELGIALGVNVYLSFKSTAVKVF